MYDAFNGITIQLNEIQFHKHTHLKLDDVSKLISKTIMWCSSTPMTFSYILQNEKPAFVIYEFKLHFIFCFNFLNFIFCKLIFIFKQSSCFGRISLRDRLISSLQSPICNPLARLDIAICVCKHLPTVSWMYQNDMDIEFPNDLILYSSMCMKLAGKTIFLCCKYYKLIINIRFMKFELNERVCLFFKI